MSLTKKRTLTAKRMAANQANGKHSRGATTRAGRERIRNLHLRHGFYSQEGDKALRALGENPKDFDAMVKAAMDKWQPADEFEERLVMRMARAMWRMERGDRMQEGYALRQAHDMNDSREDRLHARMMRLKMTSASLQSLAQAVAREHYITTPAHLELMKSLCQEGMVKEMGEIALALFLQLEEPGPHDKDGHRMDPDEMSRRALLRIKQIFGLAGDTPPRVRVASASGQPQEGQQVAGLNAPPLAPDSIPARADPKDRVTETAKEPPSRFTPAQWEAREPVRQLLEHILTRQVEICEAQRTATLRECLAGPTSYERAAEIAPSHDNAVLMRRMEDSSFRQVARLTSLLLKIKRRTRENGNLAGSAQPIKVHENKAG